MAGIDPPPDQSGLHDPKSGSISKRDSPLLRKTLFQIKQMIVQKQSIGEPACRFLERKRAEGKPYRVYIIAAANKFLRIYYARVMESLSWQIQPKSIFLLSCRKKFFSFGGAFAIPFLLLWKFDEIFSLPLDFYLQFYTFIIHHLQNKCNMLSRVTHDIILWAIGTISGFVWEAAVCRFEHFRMTVMITHLTDTELYAVLQVYLGVI